MLRTAALASAALGLLMVGGCSHYRIGIPLVPGLSLGLGATKDGNFSAGLNTGFGPLGAGVAVNNSGVVTGSASAGVGASIGPVGSGVGVGKGVVLHDPKAGRAATPAPAPAVAAEPVAAASAAPVTITKAGVTQPMAAAPAA
ncbi:hypothetical protein, partial [Variovorax sp. E3]|uniref:hypothetical protein n=1 Tax=Variovorax sp. E3 TaxID=1914993 RepID=UPI0027DE3703